MVILLAGILSAASSSLFTRQQTFSAFTARDQLISMSLLAQKRAMANVAPGNTVTLTLSQTAQQWTLQLAHLGNSFQPRLIDREGAALSINGSAMANGDSLAISFNSDAETGTNRQFIFTADNSYSLCIASTGFAYTGTCQP